ncbi:hypothetical protein SSBR45G_68170 [Bradyrhizobium sp. SSBR45G]|uniref:hypothetical protein n=1 Tax=unclassified Bradyrhizobium TaxID=2631580 RepID=UPI0023429E41|nr:MULTISPECIES: hypothetical protein [unclassified Bradyrhizobium]GLH81908.1 hypothetical protein SSBR45G_68170 [Bradyrhizobium sp. SSBR45G]GLH89387.1 hypothetical protein SSBR45R_68480 [Bradyrhizobium sp. SSBR45R]
MTAPLAQAAEAGASAPAAVASDATKESSGPFGGCEPIGLTASGELVFPLDCKKLIKKPAEAPVAEDKAAADDKTASTDAKPAAPGQASAADAKPLASETTAVVSAPPAEPTQAAAAEKPETVRKAGALDPAKAPQSSVTKASSGKPSVSKMVTTKPPMSLPSSMSKTRANKPVATASSRPTSTGSAASNSADGKTATSKSSAVRTAVVAVKDAAAKEPSAREPTAKGGQAELPKDATKDATKAAGRPTAMSAIRSMIVMARPANTGTPVAARPQVEDRPRLRTAAMPSCMQFRSYNPTTHSYRGFDGHIYICR